VGSSPAPPTNELFWGIAQLVEQRIYLYNFLKYFMVDIAQLVRASDCGSEGRGFETHFSPVFLKKVSGAAWCGHLPVTEDTARFESVWDRKMH
jgi:hypothetical protein